jgi:CheY-like chemotaxis protein
VRFDAAGSPIALSGTAINITDLKTAADERERLLQREQAAREEAERANRIKDEFLAVLSHELRTPLNPILGWTRLLQQGKLDAAKTAEALKTIARNATLQAQLIDDLLDVSRILRGKLTLTAEPVNLATVIEAAIDTVRLAADAKSMTIKTQLDPTVKSVRGDAGRLQQVVWNLLTNAIKFTPSHGRIEIRLTQSGSNTQIQVSDTGKGISPDFLPLVFERFQQVDSSITRQFGGLGLGLAIVRQIVELHGGSITADSPGEGQGATFIVTLPLPQQTLSTTNQAPTAVALSETAPLAGIRALVVDDDPDSRDFVAFVLEQEGATVVQTSAAGKGLQILAESQFDVLVSDIGMPEMDGYTFLRQLRTKPVAAGGQIPAIALTAYVGELDRQQAIAVGFQHHLAKPVNPDQLTQMILSLTRP